MVSCSSAPAQAAPEGQGHQGSQEQGGELLQQVLHHRYHPLTSKNVSGEIKTPQTVSCLRRYPAVPLSFAPWGALSSHTIICAAFVTGAVPVAPYYNFGNALGSPFAPTPCAAVPLPAAPCDSFHGRYSSSSTVWYEVGCIIARFFSVVKGYFCFLVVFQPNR